MLKAQNWSRNREHVQNLEILKLRNLEKLSGRLSTFKTFFSSWLEIPFFQAGLFFFLVLQNFILVSAAGDGDGGKKNFFLPVMVAKA